MNSRPLVDFDDETKLIRAETDRLMRRIYTSVPHPRTSCPFQLITYDGNYASKKRSYVPHNRTMVDDILSMSYYSEPSARTIGRGHLACVSFAGGRGYPRRKHLFSDEYRDIGDEIKTRSYYNNNYNRAYVDAMSLPTGFASYLLRIKPPEKNGTLTNLEKMQIIALSEERKKNTKSDEIVDDITEKMYKTSVPSLKETSKPIKTTKPKNYHIKQETKPEDKNDSTVSEFTPLLKSESHSGDILLENQYDKEKPDSGLQAEVSVDFSKSNSKRDSIAKISYNSDPTPSLEEEVKLESEELTSNTETVLPKEEIFEKPIIDPEVLGELNQTTNETIECTQVNPDFTSESIKAMPETEEQTFPNKATEDSASLEISTTEVHEFITVSETVVSQEEVVAEIRTEESVPIDLKDEVQESKENNLDDAVSLDPKEHEESITQAVLSPENEEMKNEALVIEDKDLETQLDQFENTETIVESNYQDSVLMEPSQATTLGEKEPTAESDENAPSEQIPQTQEESTEVNTPLTNVEDSETVINEVTPIDAEKAEENCEVEGKEENYNNLKHSEFTDSYNNIEEVTDMGTSEITKENEIEPLIEEPQSPESTEIESQKVVSNVISEVLSDVAEEP